MWSSHAPTLEIFNTAQGAQFTAIEWVAVLLAHEVKVSMDGKGQWMDNVFVERLWRSLKYKAVYPRAYADVHEAWAGISRWLHFYNYQRPHQALGYQTPMHVYRTGQVALAA
jgi:putative transposase